MASLTRAERTGFLGVLALALALRFGLAVVAPPLGTAADEAHWDRMARVFLEQGVLAAEAGTYRPPLYPLVLAAVYGVGGTGRWSVLLFQSGLAMLTCGLLYALGCRSGSRRTGLLAAGMGAGYPLLVFFADVLMAEVLIVLLAMVVLWAYGRLVACPTPRRSGLVGAALGLAALAKPVLIAWAPLLAAGWWWGHRGRPRESLVLAGAAALGLVLAALPWTLRNAVLTGAFVPVSTNAGINLLVGQQPTADGTYQDGVDYQRLYNALVAPETDPVRRDRVAVGRMVTAMAADPGRVAALAGRKLALLWSPWIAGESTVRNAVAVATTGPLLLLGCLGLWRLRHQPVAWGVLSLAVSLSAVHALFFAHARFRLPADAALMVPAAHVVEAVLDRLRSGWRPPQ
jgi:4-amino-4-deoxy-L-arabinose transferase-like glycosyltransferase